MLFRSRRGAGDSNVEQPPALVGVLVMALERVRENHRVELLPLVKIPGSVYSAPSMIRRYSQPRTFSAGWASPATASDYEIQGFPRTRPVSFVLFASFQMLSSWVGATQVPRTNRVDRPGGCGVRKFGSACNGATAREGSFRPPGLTIDGELATSRCRAYAAERRARRVLRHAILSFFPYLKARVRRAIADRDQIPRTCAARR